MTTKQLEKLKHTVTSVTKGTLNANTKKDIEQTSVYELTFLLAHDIYMTVQLMHHIISERVLHYKSM